MTDDYIIGIDLGTTNSCVGVWKNDRVEIISNIMGKRVTPSYVCYKSNTKILVGEQAKDQIIKNIKNTIYDTKRLIGRNFSDEIVQNDIKLWSFSVKGDDKDKPIIEVTINKEKKIFYPEQVAAQILGALKKDAEDYLGKEVKNAVITVPAYFNNSQRQSTIDAGRIAGLNVIRTINEPTAAAIAYGLENKSNEKRKILIFDFGGGTFDITIINIKNNEFDVITSQGDSHLGGEDIDTKISEYCLENFKEKTGIEISSKNQKALKRLKSKCIEAKHLLSSAKESDITIEGLTEEIDLNETINREQFNEICKEIFKKCINMVKKTISDANLTEYDIDKVVLTGGSSKIPKIQEMLGAIFGKNKLCKTINPDEAIALGASIFAYQINNNKIENFEELKIADIVPHALGVKIDGDLMDIIIPKNTKIPCKIQRYYENVVPYQDKLEICIYEGDSNYIRECSLLDTFFVKITPREKSLINVIFEIDQKFSILKISAEEMNGQNKKTLEVTRKKRENARILEMIEKKNVSPNLNIKDVVPLTLGVGSKDYMIPMIKKNTNIPCTFRKIFKTVEDDQTQFKIGIYEGENEFIKENNLLGKFYLKNITKAPKGEIKMGITFHVDDNGILNVSAHEIGKKNNNQKIEVKIKREKRDEK